MSAWHRFLLTYIQDDAAQQVLIASRACGRMDLAVAILERSLIVYVRCHTHDRGGRKRSRREIAIRYRFEECAAILTQRSAECRSDRIEVGLLAYLEAGIPHLVTVDISRINRSTR